MEDKLGGHSFAWQNSREHPQKRRINICSVEEKTWQDTIAQVLTEKPATVLQVQGPKQDPKGNCQGHLIQPEVWPY